MSLLTLSVLILFFFGFAGNTLYWSNDIFLSLRLYLKYFGSNKMCFGAKPRFNTLLKMSLIVIADKFLASEYLFAQSMEYF